MELVGFVLVMGSVLFTIAWTFAALPVLALALYLVASSGDAFLLVAWVAVSAIWLVLVKLVVPLGEGSTVRSPDGRAPSRARGD